MTTLISSPAAVGALSPAATIDATRRPDYTVPLGTMRAVVRLAYGARGAHVIELAGCLAELPREAGWLLITAGMAGVVVPGIIGTPFLVAGAMVLAPGGKKLLSHLAGRRSRTAGSAMRQIGRFLDDLDRRYPRRGP